MSMRVFVFCFVCLVVVVFFKVENITETETFSAKDFNEVYVSQSIVIIYA